MSHWFFPPALSDEEAQAALEARALVLTIDGLPSLARAQGADHIRDWLRQLQPEATPEHIATLTQHFWRLGHELLPEDTIVVRTRNGGAYIIGEVTGAYRKEGASHIWPVAWRGT